MSKITTQTEMRCDVRCKRCGKILFQVALDKTGRTCVYSLQMRMPTYLMIVCSKCGQENTFGSLKTKFKETMKDHSVSEETRAKISASNKGKHNHALGRQLSEETKAKIGANTREKSKTRPPISEETRRKMSESAKRARARRRCTNG